MPIYTKVNGSWKTITDIEVKNSIFNTVTKGYVKVNDQWKLFLSSNEQYFINILQIAIPTPFSGNEYSQQLGVNTIIDTQDPLQYQSNTIATITILTPTVV